MTTRPYRDETYKNAEASNNEQPCACFVDVNQRRDFFPECEEDFLLAAP
jgi:hypothetical protein